MLYLQTLGVSSIHIGAHHLLPSAKRAFGALLYLAEARGRGVARHDLQELLFPGRAEAGAAHSLRQLLYRLRGMGVPLEADGATVSIQASDVHADYAELEHVDTFDAHLLQSVTAGILPGYNPVYSRALARWVDDRRSAIQHDVTRALVTRLAMLKLAGQWTQRGPLARATLSVDPLNEEATLALAESLALTGQKTGAMQLLDTYMGEVAPYGGDVRLPASLVRRRISEQAHHLHRRRSSTGPFVGRDQEMAELWNHFHSIKLNKTRGVVIYGVPGIGKTRLAIEMQKAAGLDGATCITIECAPHDVRRPLSVFVDLVPKLLSAPGGLGVAPEALEYLRRLTTTDTVAAESESDYTPHHVFDRILDSIRDLLEAVAEECPLIIHVDDAHSMDAASLRAICRYTASAMTSPILFLLTSRTKLQQADSASTADRMRRLNIQPLAASASYSLLTTLAAEHYPATLEPDFASFISIAGGNPLYLRCLATEAPNASDPDQPSSLARLLQQRVQRLGDTTLRAFVATVLLAKHCRLDRLVRIAGITERELLTAIQTLETGGYLVAKGADIRSAHPLISQAAMAELPPVTGRLMRSAVADLLEREAAPTQDVALLWDAAEHWHEAGATDRAVSLLESCAQHCLRIGQPSEACQIISRALSLCNINRRVGLQLKLIEAANSAEDYQLVLQAIDCYRSISPLPSLHDDVEILHLRALRFSGTPFPTLLPRLHACVIAPEATGSHKLEVAADLIAAYDLLLDVEGARMTYNQTGTIPRESDADRLYGTLVDLRFHSFAGNRASVAMAANELIEMAAYTRSPLRRCSLLVNSAVALFKAGACLPGINAMHEAHSIASSRGMSQSLIDVASMLAWMYYAINDPVNWQKFDIIADTYYSTQRLPGIRISHYLSNKIEFAIEAHDPETARGWLAHARAEYAEIDVPRSQLLADAFELRIEQCSASTPLQDVAMDSLAAKHRLGRSCGLHDNFADAYWHALRLRSGVPAANAMLREYLVEYRRDGFPPLRPLMKIAMDNELLA